MPIAEDLEKPQSGQVRVWCDDPELLIEGWLGPESPRYTGGFGGWEITGRPRQIGMTTWEGVDPVELQFQMLWDGIIRTGKRRRPRENDLSAEPDLRDLMHVVRAWGDATEPGIIHIDGIPSLLKLDEWVIQNIEFGDAIRRPEDMHRTRVMLDWTVLEYRPPTYEQRRKKGLGKARRKTMMINVKDNDTPHKIAKRRHCKWTELRTLNQGIVKTANQSLPNGIKIRVPVRKPRSRK
jgi:hypothetical protein